MLPATIRTLILSALAVPAMALAQAEAPAIKTGMLITSADGKRVGRVYDLDKKDGAVSSVSVIRGSRLIRISASTLSTGEKGLSTTLSAADIAKLK